MMAYQCNSKANNNGFSLVELAIVLVIIGLITGGILTGQELIRSSELNSIHAQTNKYIAAVHTFKLKYNAKPGDMVNATNYWGAEAVCPAAASLTIIAGTCNGDGNGVLHGTSRNERFRFWEHLSLSGLIPGDYVGVWAGVSSGVNVPMLPQGGYMMPYDPRTPNNAFYSGVTRDGSNFWLVGPPSGNQNVFLLTSELASLDTKYDDGRPATGNITAQYDSFGVYPCVTTDVVATAEYNLSYAEKACAFFRWY